jgi:hypothetical protein
MDERWFDGDYSEFYLGRGHQDKNEFAAWVTAEERESDTEAEKVEPADVEHIWAYGADDSTGERFYWCEESMEGAFPMTRYRA